MVPAGRGRGRGDTPCPALPHPASLHQSETRELLLLPQPIKARHPSSSQPIRGGGGAEGSTAASPPANQRPAVPAGRGGGGGRGRSPWRAWHMAGSRQGAAGAGLRCWGVRPGCRQRSPVGIQASRCSCRQMWAHWTPWQCCSPRVSPQNGGVHQPPNHPCLTWSPPALWLAGSSPGSCHSCYWRGCPLIWAPHG